MICGESLHVISLCIKTQYFVVLFSKRYISFDKIHLLLLFLSLIADISNFFRRCPSCKCHRVANKKLDLWRLPRILVLLLKRFSNNDFRNKIEDFVDFPIDDFDLSNYMVHNNSSISDHYMLYAVSNHIGGGTGSGHYTACAEVSLFFMTFFACLLIHQLHHSSVMILSLMYVFYM